MCLRFQFCTHQRVCILYFLKKSQIRCTLMHTQQLSLSGYSQLMHTQSRMMKKFGAHS
jgi:hypothetical protein